MSMTQDEGEGEREGTMQDGVEVLQDGEGIGMRLTECFYAGC